MEKPNNKTDKQSSKDEGEKQRDDPAATSKIENYPERIAHNMNDFKSLDFNAADEIRQAMKSVLAGPKPPPSFLEEANNKIENQNKPEASGTNQTGNRSHNYKVERQVQLNLNLSSTAQTHTGDSFRSAALNKRKRPKKAGPSKSVKRPRKSIFYIGKLCNVVEFKHYRCDSETESDSDSVVFY